MASPQLENGYTRIANELLDALALIHLPPNEWQVLLVILRKTYGFHKKVDRIANFQIQQSTGLGKEVISRALHNLNNKNLIHRNSKIVGFNKDYSQWKLAELLTKKFAILLTEVAESATKVSSPHVTQKIKETLQKKSIKDIDTSSFNKNKKDELISGQSIEKAIRIARGDTEASSRNKHLLQNELDKRGIEWRRLND